MRVQGLVDYVQAIVLGHEAKAEVSKIMAFPPAQEYYMMLIAKLKAFVTASEASYSGMVDPGTKDWQYSELSAHLRSERVRSSQLSFPP